MKTTKISIVLASLVWTGYSIMAIAACNPDTFQGGQCKTVEGCAGTLECLGDGHGPYHPVCVPNGSSACPPKPPQPVTCSVFNDGYSSKSSPSDAVYFSAPGKACIPDGSAQGACRKWFGQCASVTGQAVTFEVFNDGDSERTKPFDAIYNRSQASECVPDGTPTGTCRKWLGLPKTSDGRQVDCYLFDDGYSNRVGPTRAIYYRSPGQVCMPDGTPTGTCRKWFGKCQVTNRLAERPVP